MEVRPGYKRTEVGVIPEGWEVSKLGDCLIDTPDYGINAPAIPYSDRLPVYIRITDITDDGRFSKESITSVEGADTERYFLNAGDLVFARTGASVGKSYLYNPDDGKLVFAGFLIRVKPNPTKLESRFLAAYVKTGRYWKWVSAMSMRSGQPGINGTEYAQLPIPLPPLPEQRAIAAALSDVDALITALERLIAKKRAIKQGAMQQLLTGKKRLPGFSNTWETKQLGELIHLIPSGIYGVEKQTQSLVGMPVATTAHIDITDSWNDKEMEVRYFTENQVSRYAPLEGDLVVVKSSGSAASIQSGKIGFVSGDKIGSFVFSNFLMLLRPIMCNPRFLFFQLTSERVKRMLPRLVEASTYPNIRINDYLEIPIPLPSAKEQLAITTILSDMDAEIAALEARRDKTRALKQGMMQELLTGRIRLTSATP